MRSVRSVKERFARGKKKTRARGDIKKNERETHLRDGGLDVARVRGGHGLAHDGMLGAELDVADGDGPAKKEGAGCQSRTSGNPIRAGNPMRVCCVCSGFRVAWTIARFARSRDRAPPLASPSRVPGGAADGLVVGLAVESLGEERLGVDRRGDVLDLVFRGRRAHGASRLGGALRLGLPLRGRRAELRGEGGTESRHGVRWWCHARGAREAGRVAGWRVECATRRRARWLSWRAREPQSSQSGFRPRPAEHMSIQSAIVGPTRTKISPSATRTRVSDSSSRNYPIRCMASSLRIRDFFTASQLERSRVKNAVRGRRRRGRPAGHASSVFGFFDDDCAVRVGRAFTPSSAPFAPLHTQEHGCHDRCPRAPRRSRGDARQPQGHQGPHQNQAQEGASPPDRPPKP